MLIMITPIDQVHSLSVQAHGGRGKRRLACTCDEPNVAQFLIVVSNKYQ